MALQLSTIRASLLRRKKDLSDVSSDQFIEWMNFIADFTYDNVKAMDPERFMSETTFTVSSDPQTSALPSDFKDIQEFESGFFYVDSDSKDTTSRMVRTGHGRRDAGYYIEGSNVIFTGIDDSSIYRLRYTPTRTRFTAITDYFTLDATNTGAVLVPDDKLQYLINALDQTYNVWDEQLGEESYADFRLKRSLNELMDNIRKEPDAFQLSDFTNIY